MRRELSDSMATDGFGEFLFACTDLKNSKYILAESKITALLKAVADNKQLYSMFAAALYGFDYAAAFGECVADNTFTLPSDPKTAIAMVFRILVDIDGGKMTLRNFLEAYFYSESINESFARFVLEVVVPFETYCRMFFSQADAMADERSDAATDSYKRDLRTEALGCVASLIAYGDNNITGIYDRSEYTACLNGLVKCIKADDGDGIISSFVGVKYAVSYFFKSNEEVAQIFKKLDHSVKRLVSD